MLQSYKVSSTESPACSRGETLTQTTRNQLDSGYETDVSPQRVRSTSNAEIESDWSDILDLDNDVFETNTSFEDSRGVVYDTESVDKEVEKINRRSLMREENPLSCKSAFNPPQRPSAPVPKFYKFIYPEMLTKCTCCNVTLSKRERIATSVPCRVHYFRPIQTNSITKKRILDNGISESAFSRFGLNCKSNCCCPKPSAISCRRRTRSESLQIAGPLPDVVACTTDRPRPASLPDIVNLCHEKSENLGQELRRIADEFETVFVDNRKRTVTAPTVYWSLLNCSLTIHLSGCLKVIRRLLSPCQQKRLDNR